MALLGPSLMSDLRSAKRPKADLPCSPQPSNLRMLRPAAQRKGNVCGIVSNKEIGVPTAAPIVRKKPNSVTPTDAGLGPTEKQRAG
jgi:hypothetical protein